MDRRTGRQTDEYGQIDSAIDPDDPLACYILYNQSCITFYSTINGYKWAEVAEELEKLVQKFWECEAISEPADKLLFKLTRDNKLVVSLAFKKPSEELGTLQRSRKEIQQKICATLATVCFLRCLMSCLCGGYLRKSGRQLKRYAGETTTAKSKVAPMLVMSLPRLELEAARIYKTR